MDGSREEKIRARAHEIWESEGKPSGRENEHWERAAREIEGESSPEPGDATGGGLADGLQPGGTLPGGGPGASMGSIGTGGGSTADAPSGTARREGR